MKRRDRGMTQLNKRTLRVRAKEQHKEKSQSEKNVDKRTVEGKDEIKTAEQKKEEARQVAKKKKRP